MFHSASPAIFLHLANLKDFKTDTVETLMKRAFENLPVEYIGALDSGILETRKYRIWAKSGGNSQVCDGPFDRDAQSAR